MNNKSQGSLATCFRHGGLFSEHLLQIYSYWVCWWNNF